ncbi:MAG TPA: non-homologous end-joining DNA ligase [Acidimicrobiales bacterium]|nr:non-homologous end-joining DNA ligase [Acidimicrobiales bacterium]
MTTSPAGAPPVLAPMLAGSTGMPQDTTGWLFEPKWDGVRVIARVWEGQVTLASRRGNDVTAGYPELAPLGLALDGRAAVLDGEIVAFDDRGRPSFERLQRRMHVRHPGRSLMADVPVLYVVFDLLWLDGRLLTGEPLTERRRELETLDPKGPSWQTSPQLPEPPDDDMLAACRQVGLEGYLGKLASAGYSPGKRSKAWTKVKCVRRREFVVGGWSEGSGSRSGHVGSLAVGWVDPDAPAPEGLPFGLRYAGQVGSGLNELLLRHLRSAFDDSASATSPFVPAPPARLHFVRPELVVEVMFNEVTTAGLLRQPSIKGLRNDIDPATVGWTDEMT